MAATHKRVLPGMVKRMIDKENLLYESLLECKNIRTNFEETHNPWCNKEYTIGKLMDLDFESGVAEVKVDDKRMNLLIKLSPTTEESIKEIGNYHGITAFIKNNYLCDVSYITEDMLTPVRRIGEGVDVYE